MFMEGPARDVDVGLRGHTSLNHAVRTQPIKSDVTLNPDQVDPARDITEGNETTPVSFNESKGGYEVSGEQAALETAKLARYRPGGQIVTGQMLVIDASPADGDFEAGLGRIVDAGNFTPSDSEVFLRLDSDGDYSFVVKRDGTETIIPQDGPGGTWSGNKADRSWDPQNGQAGDTIKDEDGNVSGRYWPLDTFEGGKASDSNPTGLGIDPPVAILPKIEGTYYGLGPYILGFEAVGPGGFQRPWPAVAFETAEQSILNQPNQPLFARFDDGGAGTTETLEVYGRQISHTGDFDESPNTPWHYLSSVSIPAGSSPLTAAEVDNADLLFALRRRPDSNVSADSAFAGINFGLLELEADIDQTTFFYLSLDPDFGGQTPSWSVINGPTSGNSDLVPVQVATQDDTSSDLTATGDSGRRFGGEIFGSGKNTKQVGDLDPVDQPTPRNVPIGVFGITTTGSSDTADSLVPKFQVLQ